jgi:uncharacterized membrane protein
MSAAQTTTPGSAASVTPSTSPSASPPSPRGAGDDWRLSLDWLRATPAVQAIERRVPLDPAGLILAVTVLVWVVMFSLHVTSLHDRYGTFDHDLGIWDQAVWLLAHGKSFITVRGLQVFGFHASPALYLFVPFYWLGAGPNFLNIVMIATVGLGAFAVYRLGRHYLHNDWHALVVALAFLVNYAGQWMLHETFHPEVMAMTPLLFMYLAAVQGRWRAYLGWLVFALLWKEDVALAAMMMGAVLAIRGARSIGGRIAPANTRRVGLATMGFCLIWFLFATRVFIPAFSAEGDFTEGLFGDLGGTATEVAKNAVSDPSLVQAHLANSEPQHYVADLTSSFGFAPLAAPLVLLIALPQTLINLLGIYNFFWTTRVHYAAIPLVATTLAAVEGVGRWRRPGVRRFLLGLMAVGAFYTAVNWGISPASPVYKTGYWQLYPITLQSTLDDAVALPGPGDATSASYDIVPHLTHRDQSYTFPNPWIANNWGVKGENRPDPDQVDWIILRPASLNESDRGVLAHALTDPDTLLERGEEGTVPANTDFAALVDPAKWTVVVNRPELLAVRRVRAH